MATPLVTALRQAHPSAYITWLVEHSNREAVDANPYVDEMISWDGGYWKKIYPSHWSKWLNIPRRWLGLRWLISALAMAYQMRRRHFDVLISLSACEWPMLVVGAGAPISIGIEETSKDPSKKFYSTVYTGNDLPTHRTNKYLCALAPLGLPPSASTQMIMGYTAEDAAVIEAFLEKNEISHGERIVVLASQTTWLSKNWPSSNYAVLADHLVRDHGCRIILTGTLREQPQVEEISSMMKEPFVSAAGLLSMRQMSALIERAALVISGDTGPMHIAAALGTPYVALFGPTTPACYAPLSGMAW